MDMTSLGVGAENAICGPSTMLPTGRGLQVLRALAPQCVVCGPAATASPGSLLEMQNLGLALRPPGSKTRGGDPSNLGTHPPDESDTCSSLETNGLMSS